MALLVAAAVTALLAPASAAAGDGGGCPDPNAPHCGVHGGVDGDQLEGDFHGLIMVPGQPGVLDRAAHAGTRPGCGDCTWTLILACVGDGPGSTDTPQSCTGADNPLQCDKGQLLYRLYLTTDAVTNELADMLCLGGTHDVIDVSDVAATDLANYLKDVVPPDLVLRVQPKQGALSGLPAYFIARPPADLAPQTFGGNLVGETITIAPAHYRWQWGDGSADLLTDDAGAPYPDGRVTHTYADAGPVSGALTTAWTATYTVSAGGQTFGPFDATGGVVPHTQTFDLTVFRARSHLVSTP